MCFHLSGLAMKVRLKSKPGDRSVLARRCLLIKFCDEAGSDGRIPPRYLGKTSNARLAADLEADESTVKRLKAALLADGWLEADGPANGGRGRAAAYKVNVAKLEAEHARVVAARGLPTGEGRETAKTDAETGATSPEKEAQAVENAGGDMETGATSAGFVDDCVPGFDKPAQQSGETGATSTHYPSNPTKPPLPPAGSASGGVHAGPRGETAGSVWPPGGERWPSVRRRMKAGAFRDATRRAVAALRLDEAGRVAAPGEDIARAALTGCWRELSKHGVTAIWADHEQREVRYGQA